MRHAIHGFVCLGFVTLGACAQAQDVGGGAGAGAFTSIGGSGSGGGSSGSGGFSGGESGAAGAPPSGGSAGQAGAAGGSSDGGAPGSGGVGNGASGGSTAGGGSTSSGGASSGGSTASGGVGNGASGGASSGGASSGGAGSGGGGGGAAPKSDCCTGTPFAAGCTNTTVQACVCAQDPYCCQVEWDATCAGETLLFKCGTCPTPADCCAGTKCNSDAVVECVGDTDSACYGTWSASCASKISSLGCGTCGSTPPPTTVVWINELHYDDASTDAGEGVEVAGSAGADLTGWTLVFYNGAPGQLKQYMSKTLSGTIPNQKNGFGTVWTAATNIQNGGADGAPEPDGVALVDKAGKVVQFLSYEGKFTPTDGPASGTASVDIGKSELSTTPDGQSLQLTGTGKKYSDFTWTGPVAATPGQPNAGQSF